MIGIDDLEAAVAASQGILAKLQSEYPDLRAYLVLAHRSQQTDLAPNPIQVLENADQMVVDNAAKRETLRLLAELKTLESTSANQKETQQLSKALAARERELKIVPEVQVEIRFHVLRYALVWALQESQWIDRKLTPQTKGSIRIVLGTIDHLSRKGKRTPASCIGQTNQSP